MLKKILPAFGLALATLLAPGLMTTAQAQDTGARPCGTDAMQQQYYNSHPGAEQQYRAFLQQVATNFAAAPNLQQRAGVVPDVTVPVVVHVLYTNPASNISDRQINDAMEVLNIDFRGDNADTAAIIPIFKQRIGSVGFQFRLAKLDPNGNCTTGITRHYSSESNTGTAAVTNVVYWPKDRYLNLWIVDGIASGAGGYTFGGALGCPTNDGIVLRRSQFGPTNGVCLANLCKRSLTHEVGHYFGLPHTWGGTNTPGIQSNCTLDDGIADTPNTAGYSQAGNGLCNTNYGVCTDANGQRIISNVQNYMDYADCESMFTLGQKAVMRAAIINSPCRRTLVSQTNLVATGTNDGFMTVPCAPIASFLASDTTLCVNTPVSFRDYSYNAASSGGALTYTWAFPGGSPAVATGTIVSTTYAMPGYYTVTETVTNSVGTSVLTRTNHIRVDGPGGGPVAAYNESFESGTDFPNIRPAPSLFNWQTNGTASTGAVYDFARWQVTDRGTAADGTFYAVVFGSLTTISSVSTAITPNVDISAANVVQTVVFSRAFQPKVDLNGVVSDSKLEVSFSRDCGTTWSTPTSFNAAALNTKGSSLPATFTPQAVADWQDLSIPIPAPYARSATFKVRFRFTNSTGLNTRTNFYMDNLRIGTVLGTQAANLAGRGISVYPNPATQETAVHLNLTAATKVQVRLTDVLGREVLALPAKTYAAGQQEIGLSLAGRQLPAGLYVVRISLDGETFNSKLTVQ